ncbi:MAG TPA: hypothetical protein VHQ03_06695, partial [Candidatus Dormibacteraeota bacterium]|nr:hypothetical protein [Candidatus Dormibacteraeota bacterium]
EVGEGKSWSLLDVKNEGVYADVVNQAGLWLLPFSGSPRELTTSGYWQAVGGGAAYGTLSSAVPSGAQYVIVRLDLSNGSQTDWFNRGSEVATIIGFDAAGNALVASQQQYGASYWLSTGALTGDLIYAPTWYGSRLNIYGPVVADGHGVWLTGYWSNGPLIILMTNGQLNGVSTLGANIAGACA